MNKQHAGNYIKCLVEGKVEYLVGKYVGILKKRIMDKQEEATEKKSRELLKAILEKRSLN